MKYYCQDMTWISSWPSWKGWSSVKEFTALSASTCSNTNQRNRRRHSQISTCYFILLKSSKHSYFPLLSQCCFHSCLSITTYILCKILWHGDMWDMWARLLSTYPNQPCELQTKWLDNSVGADCTVSFIVSLQTGISCRTIWRSPHFCSSEPLLKLK